jgi:hypothetical protein
VVTLRLIAISFDAYDGNQIRRHDKKKPLESLSNGSDGAKIVKTQSDDKEQSSSNGDLIPTSKDTPCSVNRRDLSSSHEKAFPESVCNGNSSPTLSSDNEDSTQSTCSSKKASLCSGEHFPPLHWNENALIQEPSLLEMMAHCYFPASFLVGPQFGIKQYLEFVRVNNSFLDKRFVHKNIMVIVMLILSSRGEVLLCCSLDRFSVMSKEF